MNTNSTYLPWVTVVIALVAWAGIAFFAWTITDARTRLVTQASVAEGQEAERASAARIHALARVTEEERGQLESIAHLDIISIIEAIEAAGEAAKVPVEIGQALAEKETAEEATVHTVSVIVEAQGAFSSLAHVAALLHTLPFPSQVTQVQFERLATEANTRGGWRLIVYVDIFTTVDISS